MDVCPLTYLGRCPRLCYVTPSGSGINTVASFCILIHIHIKIVETYPSTITRNNDCFRNMLTRMNSGASTDDMTLYRRDLPLLPEDVGRGRLPLFFFELDEPFELG